MVVMVGDDEIQFQVSWKKLGCEIVQKLQEER